MRKILEAFALLTTTGLALVQASPAIAQNEPASGFSDDIVVTARRVEERLQDVPISISVLNQQQLDDRNITSTLGLATYTPSLQVNPNFGPDKAVFSIRGFNQDLATTPTVGVYFAEVIAARGVSQTIAGNGVGAGGMFDLQNVQVLKGPQGTLFGRNTTGGAILLVPQKPKASFGGFVEATYGSLNQRRVQAVVNLPLADSFRVRIGIDRNLRDGYLHNKSGIGPKDFANINYTAARLSVVADLTPNLENYTIASYSNSDNHGSVPQMVLCPSPTAAPTGLAAIFAPLCRAQVARAQARGDGRWDVDNSNPLPKTQLILWQAINTTTWRASDTITVKNIASYAELRETSRITIFGENFILPPGNPNAGRSLVFSIAAASPGQHNTAQSTFTEELQIQGRSSDDSLTWQIGGYFELSKPLGDSAARNVTLISCDNYLTLNCTQVIGIGSFNSTFIKTTVHNNGIYAQSSYKLGKLELTGGIRYTWDKTTASSRDVIFDIISPTSFTLRCLNAIKFPSPTVPGRGKSVTDRTECLNTFKTKSDKPTWLAGVNYNLTDDVMVYAKYARGYRQGFINPNSPGLEIWQPDKLDTYEIGLKATFRGAIRGSFNLSAFYNDLTNQQVQALGVARPGSGISSLTGIINAGRSRIQGLEADTSLILFRDLRLELGYAYLDTKLKSLVVPPLDPNAPFINLIPVVRAGGVLNYVPKHKVSATAIYNLPVPEGLGQMSMAATYTYSTKQLQSTTITIGVAPPAKLLNLNFNWKSIAGKPIDFGAFVTNLTNEDIQTGAIGGLVSSGFEARRLGEPRVYGMRLKYRFGD